MRIVKHVPQSLVFLFPRDVLGARVVLGIHVALGIHVVLYTRFMFGVHVVIDTRVGFGARVVLGTRVVFGRVISTGIMTYNKMCRILSQRVKILEAELRERLEAMKLQERLEDYWVLLIFSCCQARARLCIFTPLPDL